MKEVRHYLRHADTGLVWDAIGVAALAVLLIGALHLPGLA
jgi:hypothetical protein